MKNGEYWLLGLLFLIPLVSADFIMPWYNDILPVALMIFVILVEAIGFWLLGNKKFDIEVGLWKSFIVVLIANIITFFVGSLLMQMLSVDFYIIFLITFVLSVLIEFLVYLIFFVNKKINRTGLFWISITVNFASYLILLIAGFLVRTF